MLGLKRLIPNFKFSSIKFQVSKPEFHLLDEKDFDVNVETSKGLKNNKRIIIEIL